MEISSLTYVARLFGVSFAVGLDPLAPVLVFGVARRLGAISDPYLMSSQFDAFASDGFLLVVGVLYVLHALADKVPFAAHSLDAIHFLLKPLAATLIAFALANTLDNSSTLHVVTLAIIIVGSVAVTTVVHTGRSALRLAASVGSFGLLVPVVSTVENVFGIVFSALVILRPEIALLCLAVLAVPFYLVMRRLVNWSRSRRAARALSLSGKTPR